VVRRIFTRCLLRPEDLPPSREDLEVIGVFNPGAAEVGGEVVLLVRVAERPAERRPGYVALPRWEPGEGPVVDWVAEKEVEVVDPRVVRLRSTGRYRLTFVSHLRVVRSRDGRSVDSPEGARFVPETDYETFGVEDPRITLLEGRFYFTYVAVSPHGVATALASTPDFRTFQRHGVIFAPENKDVVLFPARVGGEYLCIHRPNPHMHFGGLEMWTARSGDLVSWGPHRVLYAGEMAWESGRIGAGAPPLLTPQGWLVIYHGNSRPETPGEVGAYVAGALLLDRERPERVLGRSGEPLLVPEEEFEREGFVSDVVFPTGVVDRGETLLVYYGAGDRAVGVVELARKEVLSCVAR